MKTTKPKSNTVTKGANNEISRAQIELLQKSWILILKHAPRALLKLEEWSGASSQDNKELIAVILGFAAQTGTTLEVIRLFLEEEFKKNSQKDETNQNTIMRGSVLVSKLIKEHLIINGQQFLKDLLSKFVQEMIETDDVSLEIDPLRIERGEQIEDHVELLLQKTKSLLAYIFGPGLQKIPADICSIAAVFAEMAHHYAPEQIYVLVGGFLFLRFINPALLTPEQHGLVPEGKSISVTCRRNLTLVAKLIQNISNMVEVLGKEAYINQLNDFVTENRWNMENFFKTVISKKSSTISVPNMPQLTPENYYYYNNLIHPRTDQIMTFASPQGIPFLTDCLEKLSQYVHLDNFLSKKYDKDALATIQISISIDDQVFVQSFESSVSFLQASFLKDNIKVLKKEEGKLVKKREKSTLNPKKVGVNQPEPAQSIFGKPLAEIMEHQKKNFPNLNIKIPLWLDEALKFLMLKAPFTHGIFRVSGDKNICEQLKNDIDQHKSINLKKEDPHNIASLIKQFLRDIPGQLLGDTFSENIISATSATDPDEKITKIKRSLTTIPGPNRALLFRLMLLLWELDSSSYLHEMDAHNLSIVFGPTILKFNPLQLAMINEAVKELISHFSNIFSDDLALYENENIVNGPVWIQRIATPQSNKGIGFTASGEVWTSYPKAMRIWDAQTGQLIRKIDIGNHSGGILAVSAVGSYLICCTDQVIQKWDTQIQNPLQVIKEGAVDVAEVDDTIWIASASANPPNQIQIYDLDLKLHNTIDLRSESLILRIKSIGDTIWMGCKNGTILIFNQNRERLHVLPKVHQGKINDFVETTNHVWSGGDDGILHVFKKDTFEEVQKIDTRVGKAKALGVFQNKVWVCNFEKSVKVYSSDTFKQVWEMKDQHELDVIGIIHTWSKTRNCWLAWTASYDSTISWWKIPE